MKAKPRVFMMDLWATVPYYTAYLSRALIAEGVQVRIGSITYYLDRDCFAGRGLELHPGCMDVVGKLDLPRIPRRLLKLAEAMVNLLALTMRMIVSPPDILHVQYLPLLRWKPPIELWFLRFCRQRGIKVVLTVHDLLPHDTGEAFRDTFLRLYREVDHLICHSNNVQTRLCEEYLIAPDKISVIPHGPFFYDLPSTGAEEELLGSLALNSQTPVVLWQGILFPYKGVDLLLDAWRMVENNNAEAVLVIAGTGAPGLLEDIERQVQRLNLERVRLHFHFLSSSHLVALYRLATVVVYPYRAITTSGALATGLALGKAIVASSLPVFKELLNDGQNALLVDPADTIGLSNALTGLLNDGALRGKLSQEVAAMHFGDESWLAIAADTSDVYVRMLR